MHLFQLSMLDRFSVLSCLFIHARTYSMGLRSDELPLARQSTGSGASPGTTPSLHFVTWDAILEEVRCLMLMHEEFQLVIQNLPISDPILHFSLVQKLQALSSLTPEKTPGHHFWQMFHCPLRELAVKAIRAFFPPASVPYCQTAVQNGFHCKS
jgi:hypothetical protein